MCRASSFLAWAFLLLLAASPTLAAFINEGFESGDLTGWTVTSSAPYGVAAEGTAIAGSPISGNYVHASSGNFAAWALLQPSGADSTISFSQSIPIVLGAKYELGYKLGVFATPVSPSYSLTRQFFVSDGFTRPVISIIGGSGFLSETLGTMPPFPTGTTDGTFGLTIGRVAGATGVVGYSIDDFYVRQVPEPASAGIALGFGTLLTCAVRRRGR